MATKSVIEHIASVATAYRSCLERAQQPLGGDAERWARRHSAALSHLLEDHLPHGAGFDSGIELKSYDTEDETYVFSVPFHVMNEHGYYVGWALYEATVTPSFVSGLNIVIEQVESTDDEAEHGLDDVIGDALHVALTTEMELPSHYYQEA